VRQTISAPFPPARAAIEQPGMKRETSSEFVGITGLEGRPDGRGIALRFALWPEAQGRGLAREAAAAALRFGHEQAGQRRIVAVARENNFGSRIVLGGIGMIECDSFVQHGYRMVMYESVATPPAQPAGASH
jgi:RimJ/RimL family protein N-acetyltransferase